MLIFFSLSSPKFFRVSSLFSHREESKESSPKPIEMRVSMPLAAGRQQARVVATSETAPRLCRLQPSSSSLASPKSAIDLALARRRPSLTTTSAVPPAKATTTTTASSQATEASTSNAHSPSSSAHKAANSTTTSRPISLDQLPRPLRDSVVVLSAPNPRAPGGQTPVYVLGVSHVSKRSLDRVRTDVVFSLFPLASSSTTTMTTTTTTTVLARFALS